MSKILNRKNYNTTSLPVKIIQFGGGNFMRGFTDYIIQKLNKEAQFNAGILNLKATPSGNSFNVFNEQDNLYTLFTQGIKQGEISDKYEIIDAIQDSLNPYEKKQEFIELAQLSGLRFVFSNTTESGISFDKSITNPGIYNNYPANLTTLLYHRFSYFKGDQTKGLIIIPTELITDNATILKQYILDYANLWNLDDEFSNWINNHNKFYNTLVDRIVPGYPKEKEKEYENRIGFKDQLMVCAEPFLLWVIESGDELNNEIPFNKITENIILTKDIDKYRTTKVRILNGGHTAMLPVAILNGLDTVQNAIDNNFINSFLSKTIFNEIIPSLDLDQEELKQYANDVLDRFKNPFIKHYLSSIALNSISKFKVRLLPTLLSFQEKNNQLPFHLTFSFGCLIQFYKTKWNNIELPVNDDPKIISFFNEIWTSDDYENIITKVLQNQDLWDQDLALIPNLTDELIQILELINSNTIETAHQKYIASKL